MFSSSSKSSGNLESQYPMYGYGGMGSGGSAHTNTFYSTPTASSNTPPCSQSAPAALSTVTQSTVPASASFYSNPQTSFLRVHPADIATMLF